MADMVVETGSGSTTANSYCSLANADTYHEKRLFVSTWTGANDDNKEIALMWATNLLDILVIWNGYKYDEDNALLWPRGSMLDRAGNSIDVDEMPQFLLDATAEFARLLIASDRSAENDTKGFKRIKAGSVDVTINRWDRPKTMPQSVFNIIKFCCVRATGQQRYPEVG